MQYETYLLYVWFNNELLENNKEQWIGRAQNLLNNFPTSIKTFMFSNAENSHLYLYPELVL